MYPDTNGMKSGSTKKSGGSKTGEVERECPQESECVYIQLVRAETPKSTKTEKLDQLTC